MRYAQRNLAAILVLVAGCTSGCISDQSTETKYATFDDATKAHAIGNWLPVWLPKDAHSIRERHRVDLAVAWVSFEVPSGFRSDGFNVAEYCVTAAGDDLETIAELAHEAPKWWPRELVRVSDRSSLLREWSLYRCDSDLLALDREDQEKVAYVWRLAGEYVLSQP